MFIFFPDQSTVRKCFIEPVGLASARDIIKNSGKTAFVPCGTTALLEYRA